MGKKTTLLALAVSACSQAAHADWIQDMMLSDCSTASRELLAASVRRDIESSVRRAESSIEAPSSVGDLACLDSLMDVDIDVFARVGPLGSLFSNSLDGLLSSRDGSRRICRYAHQAWNEVTSPLSGSLDLLKRGHPPGLSNSFNFGGNEPSPPVETPEPQPMVPVLPETRKPDQEVAGTQSNPMENSPSGSIRDIWNLLYGDGGK